MVWMAFGRAMHAEGSALVVCPSYIMYGWVSQPFQRTESRVYRNRTACGTITVDDFVEAAEVGSIAVEGPQTLTES